MIVGAADNDEEAPRLKTMILKGCNEILETTVLAK
jgi:hypothetical protein